MRVEVSIAIRGEARFASVEVRQSRGLAANRRDVDAAATPHVVPEEIKLDDEIRGGGVRGGGGGLFLDTVDRTASSV